MEKKLFKLKKWLTLTEAAQHLSILFGEDVKVADVLRLALDGHLKLSVRFVNGTYAKRGEILSSNELMEKMPWMLAENGELLDDFSALFPEGYIPRRFTENVIGIEDVWDLPMTGGERLDIEHEYQRLTDGPAVTAEDFEGSYVEGQDGLFYQLHESWDENEFKPGSKAQLRKLEERIARDRIGQPEAEKLLESHKENREKFLQKQRDNLDSGKNSENYYPAGGLPADSILVVRTAALQELEARISEPFERIERPIEQRERTTLLVIIGALAKSANLDLSKPSKAAVSIENETTRMGVRVAARTVENHLKRVPEAMDNKSQR